MIKEIVVNLIIAKFKYFNVLIKISVGMRMVTAIVLTISIVAIIFGILYYTAVNKDRKKYQPVLIALNEIEREWENEKNNYSNKVR